MKNKETNLTFTLNNYSIEPVVIESIESIENSELNYQEFKTILSAATKNTQVYWPLKDLKK